MRDKNRITIAGRLSGEDDFFQHQNREMLSFTGSILDNTPQTYRIAKLHNRITVQETKFHKKRYFIEQAGMLSQWFDINLLDRAVSLLDKIGSRKDSSIEEEIKKTLTMIREYFNAMQRESTGVADEDEFFTGEKILYFFFKCRLRFCRSYGIMISGLH